MSFIIFLSKNKKTIDTFSNSIDFEILSSNSASTYNALEYGVYTGKTFKLFHYNHKSDISEDSIIQNDKSIRALFGTATDITNKSINPEHIFNKLSSDSNCDDIQGDYISFGIDENGNGALFRTLMSFNRLFMFETDSFCAFSSEIRLIYNSIKSFRNKTIVENYDLEFIYDSIQNEWGKRVVPGNTFINNIIRIPSNYTIEIHDHNIKLKNRSAEIYDLALAKKYRWWKKSKFYDYVLDTTEKALGIFLENIRSRNIEILISGGLDSRLNTALLNHFRLSHKLELTAKSWGPPTHPDVEIGSIISNVLKIPFKNENNTGKPNIPQSLCDYQECASISQGDWNSNNYRSSRVFERRIIISGQDNYKRTTFDKIEGMNRWYAARMQYTRTLPILSMSIINKAAIVLGKHGSSKVAFEFAYEVLKRFAPELLDIPLVGMSIPKHYVPPHKTIRESKIMPSHLASAYFDAQLIEQHLKLGIVNPTADRFGITLENVLSNERKKRIAMDFASLFEKNYI